jgi:flagellar hook-associated protein 2
MDWISAGYEEFGASSPTEEELADGEEEWLSSTLRGDSAVNGVKRQLQNLLTTMVDTGGSVTSLGQLGIATQKDGSLELNESTLDNVLESDFDDVVSMLAGNDSADGVMKEFNSTMLDLTSLSSGVYATKRTGYTSAVKQLDDQMLRLESMMDKKETTLRARFSALELLVSDMNSQSNFLTQQMSALSNMKTGSN